MTEPYTQPKNLREMLDYIKEMLQHIDDGQKIAKRLRTELSLRRLPIIHATLSSTTSSTLSLRSWLN